MKKRVTQAEFARICGVNRSTVSKWVKNQRIQTDERGLIDPEAATRQREATESPMPHHQARKAQFEEARTGADTNPAEKTPQIGDSGPSLVDLMIEETKKGLILDINQFITKPISMPGDYAAPPAGADVSAALKLETYKLQKAKAEQANLELDKMAGLLVERAEVDYVLADFGNTLRSMFEGMADRMSGSVARHRGDVNAIHKEIDDTAHDMLHEMAELMKRKMDGLNA